MILYCCITDKFRAALNPFGVWLLSKTDCFGEHFQPHHLTLTSQQSLHLCCQPCKRGNKYILSTRTHSFYELRWTSIAFTCICAHLLTALNTTFLRQKMALLCILLDFIIEPLNHLTLVLWSSNVNWMTLKTALISWARSQQSAEPVKSTIVLNNVVFIQATFYVYRDWCCFLEMLITPEAWWSFSSCFTRCFLVSIRL